MPQVEDIDARKKRWTAALQPGAPAQFIYTFSYPEQEDRANRPLPWPDKLPDRIDWAWKNYLRMQRNAELYRDDTVPFLEVYTGTEIFAEAMGCAIYRSAIDQPCARPMIAKASDVAKIKVPELSSSSLAPLFDIADELRRRAGEPVVLRLPDIQSPMDIAATMWDKKDFYLALLLEPRAVKDLAQMIKELLCNFLDEWFARYGRELIAHWPNYYIPRGPYRSDSSMSSGRKNS